DPEVWRTIGLPPDEEEFALLETGLRRQVVVARPDSFLDGDSLQFLEFNSDSPAGVVWTDLHEEVFLSSPILSEIPWSAELETCDCRRLLIDGLLVAYADFGLAQPPSAAIVDWSDAGAWPEFEVVQRCFEERGVAAVVADPMQFELRGDTLYADGTAVNLIYRRAIIREIHEKREEPGVRDFLEAYRRGLVCVVNPFRAKVSGSKACLALLSDARFDRLFNDEQNAVRRAHVPWTRVLRDERVDFEGRSQDIFELARNSKDRFVIKPTSGYGGRDVMIGRETEPEAWDERLDHAAENPVEWTLQAYVEIPEEDFPVFEPDLRFERRKVNLNPYLFGGRYAGSFVRLSTNSVINVSVGGGMAPAFVVPD
ncbi:MAG: circularly permuted type 2 ATP-grasp protein, partial [Thermoanaerobaculales bacterium]|nr:circularly permuted type 2 ATP-grasp protein [Thermoanaerobaculales bacterium]